MMFHWSPPWSPMIYLIWTWCVAKAPTLDVCSPLLVRHIQKWSAKVPSTGIPVLIHLLTCWKCSN
jgi:hypothetical protein